MSIDFQSFLELARKAKAIGATNALQGIRNDLLIAFDKALNQYSFVWFREGRYKYPSNEMVNLMREGKKLEAVKLYREANGPGTLLASKIIMEAIAYNDGFGPHYKPSFDQVKFE